MGKQKPMNEKDRRIRWLEEKNGELKQELEAIQQEISRLPWSIHHAHSKRCTIKLPGYRDAIGFITSEDSNGGVTVEVWTKPWKQVFNQNDIDVID